MLHDVVETLTRLVAPPQCESHGTRRPRARVLRVRGDRVLQEYFEHLGVPWHRQPVAPLRDNIIARLDGAVAPERGGEVLVFEAHQDTVPVDGMTVDPWEPVIRDGRLYGRGACDVKGGMACMLTAFARLARRPPAPGPTVLMACTVNEDRLLVRYGREDEHACIWHVVQVPSPPLLLWSAATCRRFGSGGGNRPCAAPPPDRMRRARRKR